MRKFRVPIPAAPKKNFKIKIPTVGKEYVVEHTKIPYGDHGLPGSVLDVVMAQDPNLIDHACGGVQACSTCHIYVKQGLESTSEVSDREQDYIDKARAPKLNSRLACCCVADGSQDLVIEIPEWNVNAVKEGK